MPREKTYKYEVTTTDGELHTFLVREWDESIANAQMVSDVKRKLNPASIVDVQLVCVG